MAHLSELMSGPQRTAVVSDCGELVEGVVAKQSGITGMALKGAVAAAKKVDAAIITKALDRVLPDVLDALDPHWQDFPSNPEQDFGSFLEPRSAEVSDSIMSVADRHAEQINSPCCLSLITPCAVRPRNSSHLRSRISAACCRSTCSLRTVEPKSNRRV